MARFQKPDADTIALIKRSGSKNKVEAIEAQYELAQALETPLRQGVLVGDIVGDIFEEMVLEPGATPEWPLDLLSPGTEGDHVAYTNPGNGRIPERQVAGDYVMIPTFGIASSVDWLLRFARDANYNVVGRAMQVLEAGFTLKMNRDAWHVLIAAGVDRNILIYDADASAGQFTKRLVSLMKIAVRRQAGGNTGSVRRGMLTDLYMSPEGMEDIRNWGVDMVDEITRREIFLAPDGGFVRIYQVNLHDLDELGVNQEFQDFYTDQLSASLQTDDTELVVGLDLNINDSFISPIREEVSIFPDEVLHRRQKAGFYGWTERGWASMDNRRVILGSF